MHTRFAIGAGEIKEIFKESRLDKGVVFRGLTEDDVPQLPELDRSLSERSLLKTLEQGSKTVIIVAVSGDKALGYAHLAGTTDLVLSKVFVGDEFRDAGLDTAFIVAFFCFAAYSSAERIGVFMPDDRINNVMVDLGITNPHKTIALSELLAQLKKGRKVNLRKYVESNL